MIRLIAKISQRCLCSQLNSEILPLVIETGRLTAFMTLLFDLGETEDEVLLHCSLYEYMIYY